MAVVTLCRPTSALLPLILPLLLPWGWRLKQKAGVCIVYGLAMVAVIAPWTYHNWRTFHRFLPLSISAGALWQGSPEFYHLTQRKRKHLDIWANELNPQRNGGHDPHTIEAIGISPSGAPIDPGRADRVRHILAEEGWLFVAWEPGGGVGILGVVRLADDAQLVLIPAAEAAQHICGPATAHCRLGGSGVLRRPSRIRPLVPFVAVCAYFTLVHMITWSEMRYSEPLHPLLAIIVVMAAREGFDVFKRRRERISSELGPTDDSGEARLR